ncbi:MAG: YCF48-related protein [Patescibacteria group bacterium]
MKFALIVVLTILIIIFVVLVIGLMMGNQFFSGGAKAGILFSEDNGEHWNFSEETYKIEVETMKIDFDSGDLLAGTKGNGVWRKKVAEKEWQEMNFPVLKGARVFDIEKYDNSGAFLATVFSEKRGRIFRLENGDEQELYFTSLPQYAIFGAAVHPFNNKILWAVSSDGGFYESRDRGENWRVVSRFNEGLVGLVDHPYLAGRLWVVTSQGKIYGTWDAGKLWQNLSGGLEKFSGADKIEILFLDKKTGILYLGSKHGLLRSYDGGTSWQEVSLPLPAEAFPVTAVATDPNNSAKIFAAAGNQIYISEDNGFTWRGAILPTKRLVSAIAINPKNSDNIHIGLRR